MTSPPDAQEKVNRRDGVPTFRRNKQYGLLFVALVVGGAGSGWYFNQRNENARSLPSLYDADIETLSHGLHRKQFTSVDLVETYIARINEVNDALSAITEINPDAFSIASKLDDERTNGFVRGAAWNTYIGQRHVSRTKNYF